MVDRDFINHHCRCTACGDLIFCPHCNAPIEGKSIVYEWGKTPEETRIFCTKECRNHYYNRGKNNAKRK